MTQETILYIKDLKIRFQTFEGTVEAADIDTLKLFKGETFGLVGETGCGKTVTSLSVIQLLPSPPGKIESGNIIFSGEDLLRKDECVMHEIRGKKIAMIFQDPTASLNPVFNVGEQIMRIIRLHQKIKKDEAEKKAIEMLELVRIPDASKILKNYPHELSGGIKQRVMIAMALSCNPDLLIADEPTTNLDVTIQAQILGLLRKLIRKIGATVLYITHNLAVVAQICDRVGVMYAGNIVEVGKVGNIFKNTAHPYTKNLLSAIPSKEKRGTELSFIRGTVPTLIKPPSGCRFHPRCDSCMEICRKEKPSQIEIEDGHFVSCFLYTEGSKK